MNDLSVVTHISQLRAQNYAEPLGTEIAGLRRQVEELRALLPALRAEATTVDFDVCESAAAAAAIASMAAATLVGISRWPFSQRRAVTGETSARSARVLALQQRMSQQ